jgi:hypothetical protein
VIGFLKGKSAFAIARLQGEERNFTGEHFWARGYAVSTVRFELEQVRACTLTTDNSAQHPEAALCYIRRSIHFVTVHFMGETDGKTHHYNKINKGESTPEFL